MNRATPDVNCFRITQATSHEFRDLYVENTTLAVIKNGRKRIRKNGGDLFYALPGQLVIFPSQTFVTFENFRANDSDYIADCVCYSDDALGQVFPSYEATPEREAFLLNECPSPLAEMVSTIQSMQHSGLPEELVSHRMMEPLIWLRSIGIHLSVATEISIEIKLRKLIGSDFSKKWQMREVAAKLACSEATLRRRLAACNTSFSSILVNVRLEHGLALLHTSSLAISQIAEECGFANPSHFSDSFKKKFDTTPTAMRHLES